MCHVRRTEPRLGGLRKGAHSGWKAHASVVVLQLCFSVFNPNKKFSCFDHDFLLNIYIFCGWILKLLWQQLNNAKLHFSFLGGNVLIACWCWYWYFPWVSVHCWLSNYLTWTMIMRNLTPEGTLPKSVGFISHIHPGKRKKSLEIEGSFNKAVFWLDKLSVYHIQGGQIRFFTTSWARR